MKRPIFVIGLTFLLISAVNISLSGTARLILGAVILLCLLAVMKKKQLRKYRALPVILAVCLISVLWVSAYTELTVSPADNMQGKTARLTGKLCELSYVSYGRYYYEIEADKLTLSNCKNKFWKFTVRLLSLFSDYRPPHRHRSGGGSPPPLEHLASFPL